MTVRLNLLMQMRDRLAAETAEERELLLQLSSSQSVKLARGGSCAFTSTVLRLATLVIQMSVRPSSVTGSHPTTA